jgi:chromosome segregation ATPase
MTYNKIKWYHYLYGVGTVTAFSFGLLAQQVVDRQINEEVDIGLVELYRLRADYSTLQDKYDILFTENTELSYKNQQLQQTITDKNTDINQLSDDYELSMKQISDYLILIDELKYTITQLEDNNTNLTNQIVSERLSYQDTIDRLEKEIVDLQTNNITVSNNVRSLSSSTTEKDILITNLRKEIESLESTITRITTTDIAAKNVIIDNLNKEIITLKNSVSSLQNLLSADSKMVANLSAQTDYLKEIIKLYHIYNMRSQSMQTINTWINNLNNNPKYATTISPCIKKEYGVVLYWYDEANRMFNNWSYPNGWRSHNEMTFNC